MILKALLKFKLSVLFRQIIKELFAKAFYKKLETRSIREAFLSSNQGGLNQIQKANLPAFWKLMNLYLFFACLFFTEVEASFSRQVKGMYRCNTESRYRQLLFASLLIIIVILAERKWGNLLNLRIVFWNDSVFFLCFKFFQYLLPYKTG